MASTQDDTAIYKVTTEGDCEGRTTITLAYATGDPRDIEVFYDRSKMYKIMLEPIRIVRIDPAAVKERRELLDEKQGIESRLREIERTLREETLTLQGKLTGIEGKLKVTA